MASIGHVLVGAAVSRAYRTHQTPRWSSLAAATIWAALAMLPDADVLGFRFGVHYADPWGHRGATHSFVFALMVAALAWLVGRATRLPPWRTAVAVAVAVVSHPLLDTMTDGGLGCALLWPFSDHRFFAPWRPIPVAPIGRAFLSARGLRIAATEVAAMAPFLIYALWPRRCRADAHGSSKAHR